MNDLYQLTVLASAVPADPELVRNGRIVGAVEPHFTAQQLEGLRALLGLDQNH